MSPTRRRQPKPRAYRWRCKRDGCRVAGEEPTQAEALAKWTAHDLTEHYRHEGAAR